MLAWGPEASDFIPCRGLSESPTWGADWHPGPLPQLLLPVLPQLPSGQPALAPWEDPGLHFPSGITEGRCRGGRGPVGPWVAD